MFYTVQPGEKAAITKLTLDGYKSVGIYIIDRIDKDRFFIGKQQFRKSDGCGVGRASRNYRACPLYIQS